jgi:hypothetical protein
MKGTKETRIGPMSPSELQKRAEGKKSPQWLPWLCVLLSVLLVAWIGHMVDSLIGRQTLLKGPVALRPNVQAKVEYPRRLHMDDQGVEVDKKIVISIMQTERVEPELFQVTIAPTTTSASAVRLLAADGTETSGKLPITATYGDFVPAALHVEHTNAPLPNRFCTSVPFDVLVTLPGEPITSSTKIDDIGFEVDVEGPWAKVGRDIWATFVSKVSVFSILALMGGWFIKDWWEVRQRCYGLYSQMQQQEREDNLERAQELYSRYQELRTLSWHRSSDIEDLHRRIEARICYKDARMRYEEAMEALKAGNREEAVKHLEKAEEYISLSRRAQSLAESLRRLDSEEEPKRETAWWDLFKALEWKADPFVQCVAASALLQQLEQQPATLELKRAQRGVVEEWLCAFPTPLEYNPFEATTAEADSFLDRHFFDHPGYRQLLAYGSQSVALFADAGGGKTSCRRMFKSSLKSPPNLAVEYTYFDELVACYETMLARTREKPLEELVDFGELVRDAGKISAEVHVRGILQQASALLDIDLESLTPSDVPWREQLRHFLENIREEKGYKTVHVLVDNVDGYAETQANLRIAELLIRHLVGNFDLLDTANFCFTFFLPASLKEPLLKYGGFTTGRIRTLDMEWTEGLLQKVLQARLKAASSRRSQVDSLMAFTSRPLPIDLDSLLVRQAQGSPRRLITSVNLLFQHRAQTWYESDKGPEELYITRSDCVMLLVHLLMQGDVTIGRLQKLQAK